MDRRMARFSAVLKESRNRLWSAHVSVPGRMAKRFISDGSRRVVCSLNSSVQYPTALMPLGDGTFIIRVNKNLRRKLGLALGSRIEVVLRADGSRYGLPMPEELEEVLRQDAEGRRLFNGLTPGRKRTLLHLVGSVVRTETRIKRAIAVVRHLKAHRGSVDYKELYRLMRRG